MKDAGGPLFGDFGANVPAAIMALLYQNGAQPFTYDPAGDGEIGINLNDAASKEPGAPPYPTDYASAPVVTKGRPAGQAAWRFMGTVQGRCSAEVKCAA